jgi:nitrogen fixation NifU-like protein
MTVEQAAKIENSTIAEELNLPPVKIHCSVLAEDAIKAAIADYHKKNGAHTDGGSSVDTAQGPKAS